MKIFYYGKNLRKNFWVTLGIVDMTYITQNYFKNTVIILLVLTGRIRENDGKFFFRVQELHWQFLGLISVQLTFPAQYITLYFPKVFWRILGLNPKIELK